MKCQICKQRESVLQVKQIIGEDQVDMFLCEVCAENRGITKSNDSIEMSLSQLLTGLFHSDPATGTEGDQETCSTCGTTIHTVRKEGKLGCSECYASFASEIRGVQKKLTGSTHHDGKLPRKLREYKELIIDKHDLQSQLRDAVNNEDYEAAAVLRDRIRDIDRQSEG